MYLLKFSKDSCNPCAILAMTMKRVSVPDVIERVVEINVVAPSVHVPWRKYKHTMQSSLVDYSIRTVPTLVLVDSLGKEIAKHTGSATENELKAWYSTFPAK